MSSILNANPINYKSSSYLSACDLVNKYNLKSVEECPKIKKIVLEFSSVDILNACEISNKKEWDSELQLKSFLLLYIFHSNTPFINLNKVKINKEQANYSVKIVLSEGEEIYSFLTQIFIENWNTLLLDDFEFLNSSKPKENKLAQRNYQHVITTKMPVSSFVELDALLNKTLSGIISKSLNIKASFVFSTNQALTTYQALKLFKNLPFFWQIENNVKSR